MSKAGEGHLPAMGRLGCHELGNSFFPESNIVQRHVEYGIWGHPTPGEVAEARRDDGRGLEIDQSSDSVVGDRLEQAHSRAEHSEGPSEDRGMDMER
jgi:hypothetical protein